MVFRRHRGLPAPPERDRLTAAMAGIGMRFAVEPEPGANVEDTLYFASIEGMEQGDLRVLALLVSWFGVHHGRINVDRLTRVVTEHGTPRVRALWSALATWKAADRRYRRLAALHGGERIDLLSTGTDFHLRRHGEDPRFASTCLRVPANVLRDRPSDIASPEEVARRHAAYRQRVMMGPSYRADLWAAIAAQPTLTASELARGTYASFASAWQVKRDFAIVEAAASPARERDERGVSG
ncbi:MAG TPA: hypothetical protein VHE35_10885 [Kofleriaceae bacterium]|nr:hypothetical protein [Kofleriaceae bacterium]